ncbi:MAG: hypothetical protein FWE34_04750 [Defluviitaleaceae bacterium]|nr:hypothetical protein [Defluviitaleaceae bacterium]
MELVKKFNEFVAQIGIDYAICGGHAIDLFLGRKTRLHKDLDVSVFWEDRDEVVQHMLDNGWDVYEPCGMEHLHKIGDVHNQKRLRSNIWCVRSDSPRYSFMEHEESMFAVEFDNSEQTELDYIEFLFNTRNDKYFLYSRNNDVKMEMETAILRVGDISYLAPELVLLYKSTMADEAVYQLDFDNALAKMSREQMKWLENALRAMFPYGHKWLDRL